MKIYIVVSTFYEDLAKSYVRGVLEAYDALDSKFSIPVVIEVPGAFEIPGMVKQIIESQNPALIITLGILIKGKTDHYEYISSSVSHSISQLTITSNIPIIFGILTTHDIVQATDRIITENKGAEVMGSGIKMLKLYDQYKK